jgi:glycogen debranching enzyme
MKVREPADEVVMPALERPTLPSYILSESELAMGASLGNSAIWINTKGTGAIERVFNARVGESLFGSVSIRYGLMSQSIETKDPWGSRGAQETPSIALQPDSPGSVELHPAYQLRRFSIQGTVRVSETTFVPLQDTSAQQGDPPVAYVRVSLVNVGTAAHTLRVTGFARLRGSLEADVRARYDSNIGALVAFNPSRARATRCFGLTQPPTRFATTTDFGRVYDRRHLQPLPNDTSAEGDILGALQLDVVLSPGGSTTFSFLCGAFDEHEGAAVTTYRGLPTADKALATTIAHLDDILRVGEVLTPDRDINEGALWSKVNMRRVMARYPGGRAFTNEPGVSSNVVGRDVAWFVYGNDHFLPDFSRALLEKFAEVQYASGKIPEYYNAIDDRPEDNGLNINDDTPLFILAVNHHVRATGDLAWLRAIYPSVARAARYVISQIDDRGLVFCTARDKRGNVWAIASWRNVISGYTLNGAVTEINAECAAALRAASHLAENLGDDSSDADDFAGASRLIGRAMDEHLLNPQNGLYYLNIDADGQIHTDVTGDQVFPVMFRVCDEDTGFRIISRLNAPDFWTPGGLRTISQHDPLYDPSGNIGLLGGVWPGLTWWYAFAASRYHPEFMVRALRASFKHYADDPKKNNTVPGQFGEYFDGESLINRGMRLSPWEPPRFLWAAVEGVCGVMLSTGPPRIKPLVPATWKWLALKRLPYHGMEITFFATREDGTLRISATVDIESDFPKEVYDTDVSPAVRVFSDDAAVVALKRPDEISILVGNLAAHTITAPLDISALLDARTAYNVCIYDSERDGWQPGEINAAEDIGAVALSIEMGGYRLISLRPH